MITKIISGGQTGADRAALDFAIKHNIPYGGWISQGRKTEDGSLPEKYRLREMLTGSSAKRTEQNVLESDGTLIVSQDKLTGGSALTRELAKKHGKQWLHVDVLDMTLNDAANQVKKWIGQCDIHVLNVAGPRASRDPKIYDATWALLDMIFNMKNGKPSPGEEQLWISRHC